MSFVKTREFKILVFIAIVGIPMLLLGVPDTLDLKFFYTAAEANANLAAKSEYVLENYITQEYLDNFYMLGYSLLSFTLMQRVTSHHFLLWLSVLAGIVDFVETWTILAVLHESICVPEWLGYVTAIKWSLIFTVVGILIVLFIKNRTRADA